MRFTEVTEARFDEMMGVVPPLLLSSAGFLVGEPWRHSDEGQPMFAPFIHVDGRFYEGEGPMTVREFRTLDHRAAVAA